MIGIWVHRILRIQRTPVDAPMEPVRRRWRPLGVYVPAALLWIGGALTLVVAQLAPDVSSRLDADLMWARGELATESGRSVVIAAADMERVSFDARTLHVDLVRPCATLAVSRDAQTHTYTILLGSSDVAWGATTLPRFDRDVRDVQVVRDARGTSIVMRLWRERDASVVAEGDEVVIGVER